MEQPFYPHAQTLRHLTKLLQTPNNDDNAWQQIAKQAFAMRQKLADHDTSRREHGKRLRVRQDRRDFEETMQDTFSVDILYEDNWEAGPSESASALGLDDGMAASAHVLPDPPIKKKHNALPKVGKRRVS